MRTEDEINIFVCETSLHVIEASTIVTESFGNSNNILLVINSPRISNLDFGTIDVIFDRHFIGNYALNSDKKSIPMLSEAFQFNFNRIIKPLALLTIATFLFFLSVVLTNFHIFSASNSPILNSAFALNRKYTDTKLYHFEEGLGIYSETNIKSRSKLSKLLFPLTLEDLFSTGAVDGVYCTHPNSFKSIYPSINAYEINLHDHLGLVKNIFVKEKEIDNIPTKNPIFILLTQPLFKNNYLDESAYREKTSELVKILSEMYHVVIKPHPGENESQYKTLANNSDVTVLTNNTLPAEILVWQLISRTKETKISVGSTAFSTTLTNLKKTSIEKYSFVGYYELDDLFEKSQQKFSEHSIKNINVPKSMLENDNLSG